MLKGRSLKTTLLVASALTGALASATTALGQATPAGAAAPGSTVGGSNAAQSGGVTSHIETIRVRARRLLLREKNSPSAVTELGRAAIQQVGITGSPSSLLKQAPSVNVYQQGIGNNEPVLSLRGTRGLETAQTLDDVPIQDLLYGGAGAYLNNLIGGKIDLSQISGVSIYPGVAYPDKNTFGTIGGTIAYDSLRPSPEQSIDLTGSVGSFHTYQEGITLNTGRLDGFLGSGDNAPSALFQYSNLQTAGFIDYTPARYNNFEFAFDKPYDDGLSKFTATVLYNTGKGNFLDEPTPVAYLDQNGRFSNPSNNLEFANQSNQYGTVILKDTTYINDYINVGAAVFYEYTNSVTETYGDPSIFYADADNPGSITVGQSPPFNQTAAGFGVSGLYGGQGAQFYNPASGLTYNPAAYFPAGSAYCPTAVNNRFVNAGVPSPCGTNASLTTITTDTYGFQPRVTLTLPTTYGVANTIKFGALIAKETSPETPDYVWGSPFIPQQAYDQGPNGIYTGFADGGTYRTIYQVFAQDKIDMVNNTFHVTPGLTFEYSDSGLDSSTSYPGTPTAAQISSSQFCQVPGNSCFGAYSATKADRELLPFVNVDYDLDKILPIARGVSLYGSYGQSALFAPVSDFQFNTFGGGPPQAAIVRMYEGGVKYNTSNLVLSADYYYQKVDRDFGFFNYQSGPMEGEAAYNNLGGRQFQGQEFSGIWQINPHWQLFGNFSHIRAVYLQTDVGDVTVQEDQFGDVVRGTPVTGIPSWLATFGVDYDHRNWLMRGDEFHSRFEAQYTGRQSTSFDLSGLQNIGPLPSVPNYPSYAYYTFTSGATTYDPNGGIEPYITFNWDVNYSMPVKQLGIGYLKKLDFDLNFVNLFNKQYYQYFYREITPTAPVTFQSGPFAGQQTTNYNTANFATALPGQPFTVTFTATARF